MFAKALRITFYIFLVGHVLLLVFVIYRQKFGAFGIPLELYRSWVYVLSGVWFFLLGIAMTSVLGKGVLRKKEAFLSLAVVFVLPILYHLALFSTGAIGGIET